MHASEEERRKGKPPRNKLWQWRRAQRDPGGVEEVQGGSSLVCSGLGKLFDSQSTRPSLKVPGNPAVARGWAGPGVAQAPCSSPPISSSRLGPREAGRGPRRRRSSEGQGGGTQSLSLLPLLPPATPLLSSASSSSSWAENLSPTRSLTRRSPPPPGSAPRAQGKGWQKRRPHFK